MSEQMITTLGTLVDQKVMSMGDGYRTRRDQLAQSGFRILRVADIDHGHIRANGPDFVGKSFRQAMGDKVAQLGDVLLTTKGTVGRVAIVTELLDPVVYSPQVCYFRIIDASIISPLYFSLWLRSDTFIAQSAHLQGNTDMAPYLSLRDLRSVKFSVPPIKRQQAIADILGTLDEKIAANRILATRADAYIRGLYEALPRQSNRRIAELVSHRRRGVDPSTIDSETVYVGLEHLPKRSMWIPNSATAADVTSGKSGFHAGDILFGKLRPYFHKVSIAATSGICSTDILVLTTSVPGLEGFVLAAVSSDPVVESVTASSEGTRMPRTSWSDLSAVSIPWPGLEVALDFSRQVMALSEAVQVTFSENMTLAALRDTLLPPLMSGKLRVRDAERAVSEVL